MTRLEPLRPAIDLEAIRGLMAPCRLCELRCGVDRLAGERGLCGVGPVAHCYNAFVHHGEEPELVPCFTVFFTGCNFRCPYCSDGEWVDGPELGRPLDPAEIVDRIRSRAGLRSVELVGGLPDVSLLAAAELARGVPPELPVVLNTNGWMTPEALALLPAMTDLLLLDVKHAGDRCATDLTGRPLTGYLAQLRRVLLWGRQHLRLGVWVRHLVIPGHRDCCTLPVLGWLAREAPGCYVNILTQYRPLHRVAGHPSLGRTLTRAERQELPGWLRSLGLPLDLRLDGRPLGRAP